MFDDEVIVEFLERYDLWFNNKSIDKKNKRKCFKALEALKDFTNRFTLDYIKMMPIHDYVIGMGKVKTFCWWVERELCDLGDIRGGNLNAHQRFGIYYSKKTKKYVFKNRNWKSTRFGYTVDDVYTSVRSSIINLLKAIKENDYDNIAKNILNPLFKNKLTYLYNPTNWIPIYSDKDLNVILTALRIPYNLKDDRIYKRLKLFKFYKELNRDDISTAMFMTFIYSEMGYKNLLRSKESKSLDETELRKKPTINFIELKHKIQLRTQNGQKRHGLIRDSFEAEEIKRVVGKKGEELVKAFLLSYPKELKIKGDIECACEYDDNLHYDFSFENENGERIYIEVKSTKRNDIKNIYFEMSYKEYEFMKKHSEVYFVFYINDVLNENNNYLIQSISYEIIKNIIFPSKYRITMKNDFIKAEGEK